MVVSPLVVVTAVAVLVLVTLPLVLVLVSLLCVALGMLSKEAVVVVVAVLVIVFVMVPDVLVKFVYVVSKVAETVVLLVMTSQFDVPTTPLTAPVTDAVLSQCSLPIHNCLPDLYVKAPEHPASMTASWHSSALCTPEILLQFSTHGFPCNSRL
jgi:hypothetical protein